LPKGSYAPRFVAVEAAGPEEPVPAGGTALPANRKPVWALAAGLALSILISIVLGVIATGDRVVISVGTVLHLVVRPYMTVVAEGLPKYPAPPELYSLFRQHRPLPEGVELSMHPVDNSVQFGHAEAATVAATTLTLLGVPYQILPERSAPAPALRGRNAILIADPQNSNQAAERLENTPVTTVFDPIYQDVVVRERGGSRTVWPGKRGQDKRYTEVYGLITVLPAEGETAGPHHVLIFSGLTSVGTQGAAEFFSRPESLHVLREKLAADGYAGFPAAYQVVVRCASNDTLLLSAEYAAHRVIAR